MMKQLTKKLFTFCLLVFGFYMTSAQNLFWEEDFSTTMGLPTGWTTADASGGAGEWAWCSNIDQVTTCIPNWDVYSNQHEDNFFATSTANGFVFMDSDILGNVSPNHVVQLTTDAIDCSGQPKVWAKFESLIGVYGLAATDNAILRVSTDGTNWTNFNLFEISIADRWSENPELTFVDISSVAAGQATVYLQFQWTGNYEYYWLLDDLQLYDADPSPIFIPPHDMQINDNFYAIAYNAMWPASQVECFGFLADIQNVGSTAQTNVVLNITIEENGVEVFSEDLYYGNITVDSLAENQPFDGCFTPNGVVGNSYVGTYTLSADSVDLVPENNTQTFDFIITDTVFAKEMGATTTVLPAASNWEGDEEPHSWAMGNYFYIVNGSPDWYASSATFGIGNADDPGIPSRLLSIFLYRWDADTNEDGNMDPDERTKVGFNVYEITGDEAFDDLITIPLLNFPSGDPGPISLDSEQAYVLMVEYSTNDEVDFVMSCGTTNYAATTFRSQMDGLDASRYAYMLGINGDLETEAYSSAGFTSARTPVVRLNITPQTISVKETQLDAANLIEISPNPADELISVKIDLVETHDNAIVRILDVNGRMILERVYDDVKNEMLEFDVSNYASGAYYFHFITDEGVRTNRFVVQH